MSEAESNKQIIQDFIQTVWQNQNLSALKDFWTEDCVNHAMTETDNRGLEGDRVVSYITLGGKHSETFSGIPPTGKSISTSVIRIDPIQDGKIAEHWFVSDAAGLMLQLQT